MGFKNDQITYFHLNYYICVSFNYAKWENYKTERVKIAEGVILQKNLNASTGKLISEEYKILIDGNY